ncbi:MAG TPA: glycosyltransferase family 1 protein [Candidatus Acidoferrum sp.]|nr:glycosyltransferase family 1 protein [Candidatus Acidoferrum sp.]
MRILYDGHIFRWQRVGGVSRYFHEIISRLPADWCPTLLGLEALNGHLPAHSRLKTSLLSSVRPRRFTQPVKRFWWKQSQIKQANLLHPTYYTLSGGLSFSDFTCPVVITVHDLIAATYPHLEEQADLIFRCQREAILRADHIICISKATERDLLERFPQLANKITVIHLGASSPVWSGKEPATVFDPPTFLFVGRRGAYKNFALAMRAFAKAAEVHSGIRLRVVGEPLSAEERWQLHFLGLSERVDVSEFPEAEALQELYRRSVALLYPSRHEGFGIPPLEAMACGTLAVTSNTTSLPEVVGDAGIMLDPGDESAWTECILQIAHGDVPREELLERGRRRAAALSWDNSAQRHVALYKRLA